MFSWTLNIFFIERFIYWLKSNRRVDGGGGKREKERAHDKE